MAAYQERTLAKIEGALEELREKTKEEVPDLIKEALEAWTDLVIEEARRGLNRPHWLLSGALGKKIKEYRERTKIFALVGFRFRENNKRDPGYYGRFHEGGWAPPGHKVTAPKKFIRRGKEKYLPLLQKELETIYKRLYK